MELRALKSFIYQFPVWLLLSQVGERLGRGYQICQNSFDKEFIQQEIQSAIHSFDSHKAPGEGCQQGSCCRPGLWNIQYDSLLNIEYMPTTKVIAIADDVVVLIKGNNSLQIENRANIEMTKNSKWAEKNKIVFNNSKSQVMLISRKREKNAKTLKIYLNNCIINQTDRK